VGIGTLFLRLELAHLWHFQFWFWPNYSVQSPKCKIRQTPEHRPFTTQSGT
jgi:hypothetical protein